MPTDRIAEAPATATVTVVRGGVLTAFAYTWEHPIDGVQEGLLALGAGTEPGTVTALWGDSWHQQPDPLSLRGTATKGSIELVAEYGGGWRWQITVRTSMASELTMQMDNVVPAEHATAEVSAGPYAAMLMHLQRA